MNRNILIFIIFSVILSSLVSASISNLGVFKTNTCIELIQTCSDCTYANITSVLYPNSSVALGEVTMTKIGTEFNYTFCSTNATGDYIINGIADIGGTNTIFNYIMNVNPVGKLLTNSQAILYFVIFIIAFILFVLTFIMGAYMPYKNKRDEMSGYILAVENLKYLKIFFLCLAYLLLMLMVYFGYIISYGYLDLDVLGNLFYFAWISLVVLITPLFIVGVFILIANLVRDHKIGEMLQRGLRVR